MSAAWAVLYVVLGMISGIVFCLALDVFTQDKKKP